MHDKTTEGTENTENTEGDHLFFLVSFHACGIHLWKIQVKQDQEEDRMKRRTFLAAVGSVGLGHLLQSATVETSDWVSKELITCEDARPSLGVSPRLSRSWLH